jgi:RNA polymerase sigma-70 factor (ECF subfamily)
VVWTTAARTDLVEHLFDPRRLREAHEPERSWHQSELSDEVAAALEQLPPHYRRVVDLVDLGGLPYRDAADRLGIPVGTVMSRLHRARRLLRRQLRDYARDRGIGTKDDAAQADAA